MEINADIRLESMENTTIANPDPQPREYILYSDKEPETVYIQDDFNFYIAGAIKFKLSKPLSFPADYMAIDGATDIAEIDQILNITDEGEQTGKDIYQILSELLNENNIKIVFQTFNTVM